MGIKRMKRYLFERMRQHRLTRIVQDLDNYLTNVETLHGLPQTPPGEVLVLSPHPDDESIGPGGTLRLMVDAGFRVDVLYLTEGAPAGDVQLRKTRREEAKIAADILGVRSLKFLPGQDGDLHLQSWLADEVCAAIQSKPYQIIFAPWPYDAQSDHAATFRILRQGLQTIHRQMEVWLYEVWGPLLANRLVKIDATIDAKRRAIQAHQSQTAQIDYADKIIALNVYRSMAFRPSKYVEGFLVCDSNMLSAFEDREKSAA